MSALDREEIISRFIAVTQCSPFEAREYLETARWNEEAAVDFFFDSTSGQDSHPPAASVEPKPQSIIPGIDQSKRTDAFGLDDDRFQSTFQDNLRLTSTIKTPVAVPTKPNYTKSIISSNVNTFDSLRRNQDSDDDDDNQGQAFYAGGSERSGQQIIGPPKRQENDKRVADVFEAARQQGATQVHEDKSTSSSTRNEKAFTGVGRSLVDNNPPPRGPSQPPTRPAAAAAAVPPPNAVEQIPIRFYSDGFTVGDGELRKLEDNIEFMEYIKRGEVPPELRTKATNGRQIEVSLEDHSNEEYKRVAPTFKPFGGTGHTIGLPSSASQATSSATSSRSTASASSEGSELEQLAAKRLNTSSSSTTIRLRLPDMSTPVSIRIDTNRTLGDVRQFLIENIPILRTNTFEFLKPPSTKIQRDDERQTINDTHLSNSTLIIEYDYRRWFISRRSTYVLLELANPLLGEYLTGGQILRNATTLSVILNIPVRVRNIRAGRSQDGLRAQHLTSVQLLTGFSQGQLDNATIGTTDIQFTPKTIHGGNYVGDTHTAGSVCLMMQTALPCLLFADGPSQLKLVGGTNTEFAPDIDYYELIFQPIAQRFNFNFDLKIIRRGYYPKGGGEVQITINPIDHLMPIDLTEFGEIKRFFGRSFVAGNLPLQIAQEMADAAKNSIRKQYAESIPIEIEIVKEPSHMTIGTASGIMIAAETTTGCLLAANALGKRDKSSSDVGTQATEELLKDLSQGACVDRYLEDQLILLMSLAKGHSKIRCGPLSDRTKTAIFVVEQLTHVKFNIIDIASTSTTLIECDGIGYQRRF